MSSSASSTLTLLSQQLAIFWGIPILIIGIVGSLLIVVILSSLKTFRQNSCAFYLLILALANLGQLCTGLFSRILITGFSIDWTQTSLIYCKFRLYFLITTGLASFTALSLAIIDQYAATSRRPSWQHFSNIKYARRLTVLSILLWLLHGVPYLVYFNHVPSSIPGRFICTSTNSIFNQYRVYFVGFALAGFLPLMITMTFGVLAYINVRRIPYRTVPLIRRALDKQLTAITLVHVLVNFIGTLPYTTINVLISDANLIANSVIGPIIQFTFLIATLILYMNFASPFYIYCCVSNRFRRQCLHVLMKIRRHGRLGAIAAAQVTPENT